MKKTRRAKFMLIGIFLAAILSINAGRIWAAEELINTTGKTSLTTADMDKVNPLAGFGGKTTASPLHGGSIGGIISQALRFIYPLAAIILFVLLIWGGIELLSAGTSGQSTTADRAKKRILAAIIGFIIVISSLLIMKVIETILGIKIIGL